MAQIKTVIFDMDGVIIDSEPIHMKIERELFREFDLEVTEQEHQQYVGTAAHEMWEDIVNKYQIDASPATILEKKQHRYLKYLTKENELKQVPGVLSIIKHLHKSGIKLALASSATQEEIKLVLNKFDLTDYFPVTVSGAELEQSKPDPQIFIKASKLSETPPENCCVIEDSQNGVHAAKAAGMRCVGFRNPNSGNQDLSKADGILDSFDKQNRLRIVNLLLNTGQDG